jgi:hypothetical protein
MRKQYYFLPHGDVYDAWDVDNLIEQSRHLPIKEVPLDDIAEIDSVFWFGADGSPATVRILVRHMSLVDAADLSFPVILGADGQVMDGMHRIAKCLLQGRSTVQAVRFEVQPLPDYVDITPEELPYE